MQRRAVKREKEIVLRSTRIGLTNLQLATKVICYAARVRGSCAGQLCGGDFVALFISADHIDQKAILYCFLSSLLPSCSHLGEHYCLGSFCLTEVSGSCLIPSLARLALPPIPGSICPGYFFLLFVCLGISNIVLAYC